MITSAILLAIPALAAAEDVAKLDVINVYSASATPTSLHQTASSVTVLTEKILHNVVRLMSVMY